MYKRLFDFTCAFFGLIILSPFFIIVAIIIKSTSKGSVFYRQQRTGQYGQLFTIVKFRSMIENHGDKNTVTVIGDQRITKFGSFIRKYKIDELPGLWNVIRGEMSLVGPRPDLPHYYNQLKGEDRKILELKPGITGPASLKYANEEQLLKLQDDPAKYHYEVIFKDKVKINLEYYYNNNLWIDLKIILATIFRRTYVLDSSNRIWLSPPHFSKYELATVRKNFNIDWVSSFGPHIEIFEEEISKMSGGYNVAALSSGTAAIHLALILLDVKYNDYVLCSSFTFAASANPIKYLGANPVFIDSEIDTWNMCPNLLEEAIIDLVAKDKKPKAIVLVHIYGMPAKMDEIMLIANKYSIPVIEDAAEALGSTYKNKKLGTFGKIGVYSFNGNKISTTTAGGALLSNDKALVEKAKFLATQARDNQPYYQHSFIGYNYRMSSICAAIGIGQLHNLSYKISRKREIHKYYKESLSCLKDIVFLSELDVEAVSNYWLSTIIIRKSSTIDRETLRLHMENKNIECRPVWKPMHMQPVFYRCKSYVNGVSENLFNMGLCLPSGTNMKKEDLDRVIKAIKDIYEA